MEGGLSQRRKGGEELGLSHHRLDHHTVSGRTITQSVAGPSHSLGILREAHHEVEERVGGEEMAGGGGGGGGGGMEMEGGLSPRRGGGEEQGLSHRVEAEADHHTVARPPHSRDGRTTQ